jgi:hypothetical protein
MKSMIGKLVLLTIPIFIFIIWLVINNQKKVNTIVKKQTTQFNKQFSSFNSNFGGSNKTISPRHTIKKPVSRHIINNSQLNKNINNATGGF